MLSEIKKVEYAIVFFLVYKLSAYNYLICSYLNATMACRSLKPLRDFF